MEKLCCEITVKGNGGVILLIVYMLLCAQNRYVEFYSGTMDLTTELH